MPVGTTAAIIGGSALLGAGASIYSSNKAADAQKKAAAQGVASQQQMYDQTRSDLAPYRDQGAQSTAMMGDLYGFNGPEKQAAAKAQFQSDPGYEFQRSEGLRAVEGSAAARGSALSGGAMKALQTYGTGLADQSYGNWYQRLANMQGMGQNAAAQTGNIGANTANNVSNLYGQAGAAQAGGYLAAGNAITGSLGDAAKAYGYYKGGGFGSGDYGQNIPWEQRTWGI
jgi:hypothetical protein